MQALGAGRAPWYLPGAPSGSRHSAVTFGFAVGAGAARLLWCQGEVRAWGAVTSAGLQALHRFVPSVSAGSGVPSGAPPRAAPQRADK